MIADGFTNRQMADMLGIAIKTVETHRAAAMKKTGANCIALLVRYAVRVGLVDKDSS
jgi:DNA-binding CsgD family transcriptional regulator